MGQNQNKDLNKWNDYEADSLANQKEKKNNRYDLLSYKSINYEDKNDSYIYGLPLQVNNNQDVSYNCNASSLIPNAGFCANLVENR